MKPASARPSRGAKHEGAIRSILAANASVTALAGDRIYHNVRRQNETRSCLVLTLIDDTAGRHFEGDAGYATGRIQVDCLAPDRRQADQLAQAAYAALDGYTGTANSIPVAWIECSARRDLPSDIADGAEAPDLFITSFDAEYFRQ